ncbi:uncharacterized protein LOC123676128 isoform X2 [Harmonia axyridis]|uniref:uncharacterized protein LOC123676128 isoform X2 n=1 Tax=Harmonia axyridis TaxID=115357 RepID=UPI001E278A9B|nr:uncharacterized protein LOC123676128 isoform X2 [Harmonia axyridis]
MSLPVSQYEALLAQVRGLRRQAQHVQQLVDPLLFGDVFLPQEQNVKLNQLDRTMDAPEVNSINLETSDDESVAAHSAHHSVSSEPVCHTNRGASSLYHGTWPVERTMWNSEPATLEVKQPPLHRQLEMPSVMSFASSSGAPIERAIITTEQSMRSSQQLEAKVDMVYSLLAMLGGQEHADMGETLFALSTNPESCLAMRESGCIPLLVQLVQSDRDSETRKKATKALHNLVQSQPDEKLRKREIRILKLLETVCAYNEALLNDVEFVCENLSDGKNINFRSSLCYMSMVLDGDKHPVQTIAHLMKLSFDEGHRQAICQLGGIHTIAKLVEAEHSTHGSTSDDTHCIMMRRYACMALTNLTFGDSGNKALLCSYRDFMKALVVQLQNPCDELRQVTASVLRNLSWRADSSSKEILREIGSVKALMKSAMLDNKENTLKSILSALWNLSAHCTENKSEICAVKGALEFLIQMLLYKSAPKSLAIIENAGGILRNISSQIAVRDDYREILREHNCLQILLDQLKSPSLTIVSNACGTLWNLSAKNATDQELLWQLGAPTMLKSLNHSKHKMIAMGSSAALKNLLTAKPGYSLVQHMDSTALSLDLPELPTLGVRKQKALLKGLDQSLSETFDNLDIPSDKKKIKNEHNQRDIPTNSTSPMEETSSNSYASLNMNESSVNVSYERKSRIPQSSGSSSLPYMNSELKHPFSSTPNKPRYSDDTNGDIQIEAPGRKIPKKQSLTLKKTTDTSQTSRHTKGDKGTPLNKFENDSSDFCLKYTEVEVHQNESENVSNSRASNNLQYYATRDNSSMEDIDNDKHKLKKKNKEIVANMDEKDHCSTEDISDSEVQPSTSKSKVEFNSLQTYKEDVILKDNQIDNGTISMPFPIDDTSSNSSLTIKENNSSLPLNTSHPKPRPRKISLMEKPQPVPRSLKTYEQNIDESNGDSFGITTPDTSSDIQPKFPNIQHQEESIEDNIEFREELNEKQDVGREKKSNVDFHEKEITRTVVTSTKTTPCTSKYQQRKLPRNSGIPMSKLPSRSAPVKSVSKIDSSDVGASGDSTNDRICTDVDEVDKPVSSKEINNTTFPETTEANLPARYEQESNMRTSEAIQAPNMDLNGKYDDILFERRRIFSNVPESDVSSSKEEISLDQDHFENHIVEVISLSEEDKIDETSVSSSSDYPDYVPSSHLPENSNGTSEAEATMTAKDGDQEENFLRKSDNNSAIDDNLSTDIKKSESNKSLGKILDISPEFLYSPRESCMVFSGKKEERLEMSCNDSANVDTRMLDPEAMIESLDRFTAELVSQASSHLQNKDSLYKSSNNDNTWDENSSPNEATFPSISVSAPNVVSFNSDSENNTSSKKNDLKGGIDELDMVSNDYSSLNTTTMTESTLIAMEATKMAEAFKEEVNLSTSVNSLVSLELDQVQPPSHLNSLSNSIVGFLDSKPNSPKMTRKKSLPSNIMVKRALNHSLSHNSSVENLDHQMNSVHQEGTSRSTPTFPNDISELKKSFIINGPVNMNYSRNVSKMPSSFANLEISSQLLSVTDLDNINPPSILNEVTDLCSSLADVASTSIGTETEVFEDCFTHVTDNYLQTENDVTEFSDANSITPIQSSATSSSDNTPKRQKSLSKSLTSKQKRALAKERYKTYIIAAEMVMKDSIISQEENSNEVLQNIDLNSRHIEKNETKNGVMNSASENDDSEHSGQTFLIDTKASKLSPKERRLNERSRFQTQVLEVSQIPNFHNQNLKEQQKDCESDSLKEQSPTRSKISIRKNILQKRLTNKERFKTQTLDDSQLSSIFSACENPIPSDAEMYLMVEKEANKVLKTLRDTSTTHDEILDCETISLVSNDDESEPNSRSSVNYRTYHKSWGLRNNIPVITSDETQKNVGDSLENCSIPSDEEVNRVPPKPKIIKPDQKKIEEYKNDDAAQPKGIRGRRKNLYTKSNLNKVTPKSIRPVKNVTSNLVKNVTSTLKSATPKPIISKPSKIASRPPTKGKIATGTARPVSASSMSQVNPNSSVLQKNSKPSIPRPASDSKKCPPKPLERQGTFTKDDNAVTVNQTKSKSADTKIPVPGSVKSSIPKMSSKQSSIPRAGIFKSASSDRSSKPTNIKMYNRSTSADSRESSFSRKIQSSLSSHSLKSEPEKVQPSGAIKKTMQYQRLDSNTNLNGSNNTKKQVTSKIASIWKKIEESKKKTVSKKDSKKWIEAEVEPLSDASNSNVISSKNESDDNAPKRISRLGSFVNVDENDDLTV